VALDGAHEVAFGHTGRRRERNGPGERVGYTKVWPDADLRLSATGDGVKEAIVVRSAAQGRRWRGFLRRHSRMESIVAQIDVVLPLDISQAEFSWSLPTNP
jgi:hypothetical protein